MEEYKAVLKKYAVFEGRATRKEYWMFTLFNFLVTIGLSVMEELLSLRIGLFGVLTSLYLLAVIVPSLAVTARRLHDTDHSGWWMLLSLVPLIGPIILLIWMIKDSVPGENMYGPNPKGVSPAQAA